MESISFSAAETLNIDKDVCISFSTSFGLISFSAVPLYLSRLPCFPLSDSQSIASSISASHSLRFLNKSSKLPMLVHHPYNRKYESFVYLVPQIYFAIIHL